MFHTPFPPPPIGLFLTHFCAGNFSISSTLGSTIAHVNRAARFFFFPFFSCHACAQNTIEPSSLLYPLWSADEVLREPNLNPPGMEGKREMVEGKKLRSLPFRTFLFLFLLPPRRTSVWIWRSRALYFKGRIMCNIFWTFYECIHDPTTVGWSP